jgi:protein ImuA
MPALSSLVRAGRYIAWITPPYLPYAPALAQRGLPPERMLLIRAQTLQQSLWATEQALRCPAIGAVLSWPAYIVDRNVRRLQLAAEAAGTVGFLYRPPEAARESSPAALRLRLQAS